jgi:hypothetical protein
MHTISLDNPFTKISNHAQRASKTTGIAERRLLMFQKGQTRIAAILLCGTLLRLLLISRDLNKLIDFLNSAVMDSGSEADIRKAAHDLGQLIGRLGKMLKSYESIGLRGMPTYRPILDRVNGRRDHLSSIVEGMHLSLDKNFVEMIGEAAEELRAEVAGSERSSRCQPVA